MLPSSTDTFSLKLLSAVFHKINNSYNNSKWELNGVIRGSMSAQVHTVHKCTLLLYFAVVYYHSNFILIQQTKFIGLWILFESTNLRNLVEGSWTYMFVCPLQAKWRFSGGYEHAGLSANLIKTNNPLPNITKCSNSRQLGISMAKDLFWTELILNFNFTSHLFFSLLDQIYVHKTRPNFINSNADRGTSLNKQKKINLQSHEYHSIFLTWSLQIIVYLFLCQKTLCENDDMAEWDFA